MHHDALSHVTTWVFDLDNTLYPPSARLFDQIQIRMTDWVMEALAVPRDEADRLRAHYWQTYGTTLAGLIAEHRVDPLPYLTYVHDIDFSVLSPDPALYDAIKALPGRVIIYTNGAQPYAEQVLAARGLTGLFDAIYGVEHASFQAKPNRAAFDQIVARDGFDPARAVMFEDDPRNLEVPKALGMATVHVAPMAIQRPYIDWYTADLAGFLKIFPRVHP